MKTQRKIALITMAMAMALATVARANLIANGSFEEGGYVTGAAYTRLGAGSTAITGWTVGGDGVDWHVIEGPAAHFGRNGVDGGKYAVDLALNYSPAGSISQSFSTVPGEAYRLSFLFGAPGFDTGVEVMVGDAAQEFRQTAQRQYGFPWVQETLEFTALGPTTTLNFQSLGGGYWGPVIDDVRVNAVPDASNSMMLVGVGLASVVGVRARAKR